jgi:hypothetical protein
MAQIKHQEGDQHYRSTSGTRLHAVRTTAKMGISAKPSSLSGGQSSRNSHHSAVLPALHSIRFGLAAVSKMRRSPAVANGKDPQCTAPDLGQRPLFSSCKCDDTRSNFGGRPPHHLTIDPPRWYPQPAAGGLQQPRSRPERDAVARPSGYASLHHFRLTAKVQCNSQLWDKALTRF